MKIGIVSTPAGPTLAAIYGNVWVSVPKALKALGEMPVNEMASFIQQYNDSVISVNQSIRSLLENGQAHAFTYPLAGAEFLPPVPSSPVLFTARGNSACFVRVLKSAVCKQPVMEHRYGFNLAGHNALHTVKDGFRLSGWNYEMVCVMGRPCHGVSKEDAYDYVFGYTNMLDHSGKYKNHPFQPGNKWDMDPADKVFADYAFADCFNGNAQVPTPIGPYITTKDEVGDPHDQMLEERESGRLVSLASARAVVFTFDEMISYMSSFLTLQLGDMISSASITYDGYPNWPHKYPEGAYIQGKADKLGTLRLRIRDDRTEV